MHLNESMVLKMFICTDLTDEQSAFDGLKNLTICPFISFLSLQLNEFPQSEIKQNYLQFKTFITAIADKKIISVFFVSGVIVPPTLVCRSN